MLASQVSTASSGRRSPTENSMSSACRPVKLFIGGLTRNTTTKLLRDHFSQYGRILDCVAMVQPDGRPRGFGYVTLDSQDVAERCVNEPQVIDGRVVDMKRAVPGSPSSGGKGGQTSPTAAGAVKTPSNGDRAPTTTNRTMLTPAVAAAAAAAAAAGASPFFPPGAWEMAVGSPTLAHAMAMQAAQVAMAYQAMAYQAAALAASMAPKGGAVEFDCVNLMRRSTSSVSTSASVCESLNPLAGDSSSRSMGSSAFGYTSGPSSPAGTPSALNTPFGNRRCFAAPSPASAGDHTPQKVSLPLQSARRFVLSDITNLSPAKVTLASAISTAGMTAPSEDLGVLRSWQPSSLGICEDELEGEGEDDKSHMPLKENTNPTPSGHLFPPGLSPPRHLREFVAKCNGHSDTPALPATRSGQAGMSTEVAELALA
mmetsp:Transcript_60804/g.157157  ORF Transcript_60804/g.157157 Transcript_60804/m.157157 type:complete len:427 (-) Transcript_60804:180-1460(-)